MRTLNALVYDDDIDGGTDYRTDPVWNSALGRPDKLWIMAVVSQASSTTSVTIQVETSVNNLDWHDLTGTAPINTTVTAGARAVLVCSTESDNATGLVRLKISLGSGEAHIRVWVTGRGP